MPDPQDVIIIGGGVIGALCAYHLCRESGTSVTIIDRDRFGAACSFGNCGYICPSHALPLTQPGIVNKMAWTAWRRSSPLYIKPRASLKLLIWLWKFSRRCNEHDMFAAAEGIHALLQSSRTLYDELFAREKLQCDWQTRGLMFVYQTRHEFDHYGQTASLLAEKYGLEATRHDADELLQMEPALKPGAAAGAWVYPNDAHLRPDRLMTELRRVLEARGVKIIEHCSLEGFDRANGNASAVRTSKGTMSARQFVVATGAMTPLLSRELGANIPIQPGKGYSITMNRPAVCPSYPMIFEEHRVAVTPWASGYRIGSTMEFSGYDTTMNRPRLDFLRRGAEHYLKEPHCEPVLNEWYGWRPMTWDSLPIIDRSPRMKNVLIAAGHNMLGLSMAPATGKLVAEMLSGRAPHISVEPYRVTRF